MTKRKKKLLFYQSILLFLAIIIFYFFYYHGKSNLVERKDNTQEQEIDTSNTDNLDSNFFENVEYKGIDPNGNRYILRSELATFNDKQPELIDMSKMNATFFFKNGKVMSIYGDKGKYNNKTNDMQFRENVRVIEDKNEILSDNLDYYNLKRVINVYGNVKGKGLDGNFTADLLELDINRQSVDFSMKDSGQVKVNVTR